MATKDTDARSPTATTGGTPPDLNTSILENAEYHAQLHQALSEVDNAAPADLRAHASYVRRLERRIAESEEKVEVLAKATKKERKEHESIRDSKARKFLAKIGNRMDKFAESQSKEEREYVEALQNEMEERDRLDDLKRQLISAAEKAKDLKIKNKQYTVVKKQLDGLYSTLFDGPTEASPDEDTIEQNLHEARNDFSRTQAILDSESQVAELLKKAANEMKKCCKSVENALSATEDTMWNNGAAWSEAQERIALEDATKRQAEALQLLSQAKKVSSSVNTIDKFEVAEGSFSRYDYRDIISRPSSHLRGKVMETETKAKQSYAKFVEERDAALKRVEKAEKQHEEAAHVLEGMQLDLFNMRRAIFESVVASAAQPPGYGL